MIAKAVRRELIHNKEGRNLGKFRSGFPVFLIQSWRLWRPGDENSLGSSAAFCLIGRAR